MRPAQPTLQFVALSAMNPDPYAMVRLRRTNGANYDVFNEHILSRLAAWEKICTFDVVGADRHWVALQFSRLPENICAFAEVVFDSGRRSGAGKR
jgi:hypothetical protein